MEMEWIDRLNQAISYMEEHLTEEISYEELGHIAHCSSYHFQRMFGYIAGVSLSEYIRRRKMSLAAVDLRNGEKVIDVALKYGYSSPTAFHRAFQSVHGHNPSQLKGSGAYTKSYPPLTFKLTIKGAEEMNYRIEKKDAFRIVGVSCPMFKDLEQNFRNIPQTWDKAAESGLLEKLPQMMDTEMNGVLGVCACEGDESQWKYYISVATTQSADGLEEYVIPAATWAIFPGNTGNGSRAEAIQELEQRIVTEWLPTSGYSYANGPDIEVYLDANESNMNFEIWIPVNKK